MKKFQSVWFLIEIEWISFEFAIFKLKSDLVVSCDLAMPIYGLYARNQMIISEIR